MDLHICHKPFESFSNCGSIWNWHFQDGIAVCVNLCLRARQLWSKHRNDWLRCKKDTVTRVILCFALSFTFLSFSLLFLSVWSCTCQLKTGGNLKTSENETKVKINRLPLAQGSRQLSGARSNACKPTSPKWALFRGGGEKWEPTGCARLSRK